MRRIEEKFNKETKVSARPQDNPDGKTKPLGSPGGNGWLKKPTLRAFLGKRSGLEGSQGQAVSGKTSNTTAEVTGGRDLMTKPNIGTKGRFGDTRRREGRIKGLDPKPRPMDRFVVRDLPPTEASEEATYTGERSI